MKPIYNEESAVNLDVSFLDFDGSAYTPNTITFRVDDDETGTQTGVPTPVATGSTVTITVPATANVILDPNDAIEDRTVTITADDGTAFEHNEVFKYSVRNFRFV